MFQYFSSLRARTFKSESLSIFLGFSCLYIFLAWVVCGGDKWWVIDYVDGTNIFYGDDAYRFFLARSAWINPDLYTYNFVLPAFLFLDGTVVSLAGGDLFLSRCIHAIFGGLSVALVWGSGCALGIKKSIMLPAILVMGLLPRYALTSLSFYGEAWLVFILCLLILLFLHKRYLWLAIFSSMMPLIRPEGMFFWVPLWFYMVKERRWRESVVMLLPGLIYFVYLNVALPSLSDYGYWRIELRKILNKLILNKSSMDWVETYSLLLVIPSFLGWLYHPLRQLWPFLLGAALWFGWLLILMLGEFSDYEDRYTYILIPIIILLWSGFFAWLHMKAMRLHIPTWTLSFGVPILASIIVLSHFFNMYMIKGSLKVGGAWVTARNVVTGNWDELFLYDPPEIVAAWQRGVTKIEEMLNDDPGIDRLVIFDHSFYYFLDPEAIPRHVNVGYATNGYRVFHVLFDGQVFAQHPGGKMYSYLEFSEPNFTEGEKRALYVDLMPLSGYPYAWKFSGYEMYLFSYKASLEPKKSLDGAPMIDLKIMEKAYDKWW